MSWTIDIFGTAQQKFDSAVVELKNKAAEFSRLYSALLQKESVAKTDPELYKSYQALMNRADWVKGSVEKITGAIDWTTGYISGVLSREPTNLSGLGILPVLGVAAIAGAISILTIWISDAYVELRKLDNIEKMAAKYGADPEQMAKAIMGERAKASALGGIGVVAVIFAGLYFLGPEIKKAFR